MREEKECMNGAVVSDPEVKETFHSMKRNNANKKLFGDKRTKGESGIVKRNECLGGSMPVERGYRRE
jgi:hypothetical protein